MTGPRRRALVRAHLALALVTTVVAGGCGGASGDDLTIVAPSAVKPAVAKLARSFERAHDVGVDVRFVKGTGLLEQVKDAEGSVDAFISTDKQARRGAKAGLVAGDPSMVGRDALLIVVPPGNPARVTTLGDFARPELRTGLCAPDASCGRAVYKSLTAAGVIPQPGAVARSQRELWDRFERGELDALVTWRTRVRAHGAAREALAVAEADGSARNYVLTRAKGRDERATDALVDYTISPRGRAILDAAGLMALP